MLCTIAQVGLLGIVVHCGFYLEGVVPPPLPPLPNKFLETPEEAALLGVVGADGLCPDDPVRYGVSPNWTAVL